MAPVRQRQRSQKGCEKMTCPNCGKELREGAKFCTGCGKQIPRCPGCGRLLQRRARFCSFDGTPIPDEINALIPEAAPEPPKAPENPVKQAPPKPKAPPRAPEKPRAPQKQQKKKSKGLLIALLAMLIVAVLAVAVFFGIKLLGGGGFDSIFTMPAFIEDLFDKGQPAYEDEDEEEAEEEEAEVSDAEDEAEEAPAAQEGEQAVTDAPEAEAPVLMPNCVGLHYSQIAQLLADTGCTPRFEYAFSDEVEADHVISQDIPQDTVLTEISTVVLTVSKGPDAAPEGYDQKVVVTAASGSSYGTLTLYNWENGDWVSEFSCDATVGKNGISESYGEGTKRTPQGVFKLGVALSANSIPNDDWPLRMVTSDTCVVDDTDSVYYNTIQSVRSLPSGVSYDPIGNTIVKGYSNVCIYIEHNGNGYDSDDVVPGKGSVITICGRYSSIKPTNGCVDISSSNMTSLLGLLDYNKNPHIEMFVR